jgi:hypothetical protein
MSETFQALVFPASFMVIGIAFALAINFTNWFKW